MYYQSNLLKKFSDYKQQFINHFPLRPDFFTHKVEKASTPDLQEEMKRAQVDIEIYSDHVLTAGLSMLPHSGIPATIFERDHQLMFQKIRIKKAEYDAQFGSDSKKLKSFA
ncbi:hypothetical protein PGT21_013140 [Puccinia graminis f. sp. tritici]|uniref:Uncharacterized protein n=1 Tax=Puccinia graminis f. sp. tritici TaxID=56615 RepID=A0A5B0MDB0_PUCGR|nr:hypothetical protein PGT21_013140 [Puccinia graminis f. sp. tritici]